MRKPTLSKSVLRGGVYWYRHSPRSQEIRLGTTRIEAMETLRRIADGSMPVPRLIRPKRSATPGSKPPREIEMAKIICSLYHSMVSRAGASGQPCMTRLELAQLIERAAGRCEVSGIRFRASRINGCLKRPWAPSLDRIERSLGYVQSNCRIVCTAANLAMNEWGEDALIALSLGIVSELSKRRNAGGEAESLHETA